MLTSFRLIDSHVRNLTAHFDRLGLSPAQREVVRAQLREAPPGASNPLVFADGTVQHRPDRPFSAEISVDPIPHEDLRIAPTTKGPDLPWLATRLARSTARGFDEGLLSYDGLIVEGIFSAPIRFSGRTCFWSNHPRALPSTTLPSVLDFLRQAGYEVRDEPGFREFGPLWLINAFSGVRAAGGPDPREVNAWLWAQAERV